MTDPYYSDDFVTLYLGDCREVTEWLEADVLITDPPYPNNAGHFDDAIGAARQALGMWSRKQALVFWSELEHPPVVDPELVAVHIWHRSNVNGRPYEPCYEYRSGPKRRSLVLRHAAVFDGAGPGCAEYLGHPTQKPMPLMARFIEQADAGTVADPFAGAGSTLRAAKDAGRKAIGVELEERYCEIAARRLAQGVLDFGGVA